LVAPLALPIRAVARAAPPGSAIARAATGVVSPDAIARGAAEELPDRQPRGLPENVPQSDVDCREGAQLRPLADDVSDHLVQPLPDVRTCGDLEQLRPRVALPAQRLELSQPVDLPRSDCRKLFARPALLEVK